MISIPKPDERREITYRLIELSRQDINLCLQCGKCSSGCSFASEMDQLPHQLVHLAQLGLIDKLSGSKAIWFCATCFTCESRCPVSIDIAALAEALRLLIVDRDLAECTPENIPREVMENVPQQALVSLFRKYGS